MNVLTQHNDNQRTGLNPHEPNLTVDSVRTRFGRVADILVDPASEGGPTGWNSQIVAQPLLASGVAWPGAGSPRDVLIVCTMHGTVYAFDATHNENPHHAYPRLWATWLGPSVLTFPGFDQKDIWQTNPEWGILGTPVIDADRERIYVVAWNPDNGGVYRVHSLDLTTGLDVVPAQIIQGSFVIPGSTVTFDPVFQKQRPGILLIRPETVPVARRGDVGPDGTLYIAFGASAEGMKDKQGNANYYGWVFARDARTLAARGQPWCATPKGRKGGIWQAGQGLVGTPEGDIILMTGDGSFDGQTDFGQSIVKLSGKDLSVLDSFTPWDWRKQNAHDLDLGSSGPTYVESGPFVIGGGKTGVLYSVNPNAMGKVGNESTHKDSSIDRMQVTDDPPAWHGHAPPGQDGDHHIHGSPVYFENLRRLFVWGENDVLRALTLQSNGKFKLGESLLGDVVGPSGMPGGMLALTSSGANNPIVWALMPAPAPFDPNNPFKADANQTRLVKGVLRAIDAATLKEIWNSDGPRGGLPWHFAKFSPATVVNDRAYVPTYDGQLVVYGMT